jgi:2-amino-4-hydroxy-6-hydroxymethyldihydropteridine diphosphokinase
MADAALSLGSNLGDKRANLGRAIERLSDHGVQILARSADYRTPPWGPVAQDWFVNACLLVRTGRSPQALLDLCLEVEGELGRVRDRRYGPRVIDIDILTYDDLVLDTPDLTIPHPRLRERAFVLVPLAEIAPDLMIGGWRVADAAAEIGKTGVERFPT